MEVSLRHRPSGSGEICRMILDQLPQWFGIPEANDDYAAAADREPCIVAEVDGQAVGIVTLVRHSPFAAEVHLMAVVPHLRRRGVGTALLREAEALLAGDGVEFLQVKTLSARSPDPGYAKTRAFYEAYGFRPLEEMPELWHPSNPALLMVKTVPTR